MSLLLLYNQGGSDPLLIADKGTLTLTGKTATVPITFPVLNGTLTLTGEPAAFIVAMPALKGTLTLTGEIALSPQVYDFKVDQGTLTLSGKSAAFGVSLEALPGRLTLFGRLSDLRVERLGGGNSQRRTSIKRKPVKVEQPFVLPPLTDAELPPLVSDTPMPAYTAPPPDWFNTTLRDAQDESDAMTIIAQLPDPLVMAAIALERDARALLAELV